MIERGCDTSKSAEEMLGCSVDGTANSDFRSITCYCDTARCNGLSVEALVCKLAANSTNQPTNQPVNQSIIYLLEIE